MSNNPVYSPEFIPYYPKEAKQHELNKTEAIIYGFIRFYTKNGQKFYFSNEDIARIADCGKRTVSRALSKFEKKGLFSVAYSQRANGGTIRFINPPSQNGEGVDPLAKMASLTSQNGEGGSLEKPLEEEKRRSAPGYNKKKVSSSATTTDFGKKGLTEEQLKLLVRTHRVLPSSINRVLKNYLKKAKKHSFEGFDSWCAIEKWRDSDEAPPEYYMDSDQLGKHLLKQAMGGFAS